VTPAVSVATSAPPAIANPQEAAASAGQPGAASRREEPEAFDLGAASREAVIKRVGPVLVGLGLLAILIWLIRR